MAKLKNSILGVLWYFGGFLKKKIVYFFREVIAWFCVLGMEIKELYSEIKYDIENL